MIRTIYRIISLPISILAYFAYFFNLFSFKQDYLKIVECIDIFSSRNPPIYIIQALILSEDKRYLEHPGFDLYGIARAIIHTALYPRREGASTIEQQLVRVITSRYEITASRKLREILLASLVSDTHSKQSIINAYLEVAYFGINNTGLNAIFLHFNIKGNEISLEEASKIVSLIKYPVPNIPNPRWQSKFNSRSSWLLELLREHSEASIPSSKRSWLHRVA